MDKSWMYASRTSLAYQQGVTSFLKFALKNAKDSKNVYCPCTKCGNLKVIPISMIKDHLYFNGIDVTYTVWKEHGEVVSDSSGSEESGSVSVGEDSSSVGEDSSVEGDTNAEEEIEVEGELDLSEECRLFKAYVDDANKPLYPGCVDHSKLGVMVRLFNLKAKQGMSDAAFGEWLAAIGDILPDDNEIPASVYEAKKTLSALGIKYIKFHACPNDCILYRKQYADDESCPTCGLSRWKLGRDNKVREGVPAKVMWYFPLIARLIRMFESAQTSKLMTSHAEMRPDDGFLRHPADAVIWKLISEKWPEFGAEPRNLHFALSSDGFNPHSGICGRASYSCWPVILVNYNLPSFLCMKRKYMMLTMLISGPRQPGNDIDVYLQPLIDDLILLWAGIKGVYDAARDEYFTLKACLLWTINDFPAYGNLSGSITRGYNACPICVDKTSPKRLVHSRKMAYMRSRRFLRQNHPYRKQRSQFDGHQELDSAPVPLTGEEVLQRMEEDVSPWPFGKSKPMPVYRGEENKDRPCWKKRSIFFELEYWKFLPVRHCLDVMHIEKNVCESLLGTLLNIPGKTKDALSCRLDLVEMKIRPGLHPNMDARKKDQLPLASWNLNLEEKKCVCGSLFNMKVPEDYCSNIQNLFTLDDIKISSMKSHDCHVLMQQLLPVALRGVLDKPVRVAVIRLCLFFTEICSKTLEVDRLPKIQSDLAETLCLLEMYFPPSFFDIMVHLTVHLVREIELCGPVYFRWMYPFERYMKVCKGYIRNPNRVEGCIAENYIAEEAIEYLAERISVDSTVGLPKGRSLVTKHTSGAQMSSIYGTEYQWAHLCILQNTDEFIPYFEEHLDYLKTVYPKFKCNEKWLRNKQNKEFTEWVKKKVSQQLAQPDHNISERVRWLSKGPNHEIAKFNSYMVNGVQFYTKSLDNVRSCQNSGVYLVADTMQVASGRDKAPVTSDMSFYGVIQEIWCLDYIMFNFPLFMCDWCDTSRGFKVDDLGFTLVNFNRKAHNSDKFVLGNSVEQVFYVQDTVNPSWSVVLRAPEREVNDLDNDDELGDVVGDHRPLVNRMPEVPDVTEESEMPYMRDNDEGILIVEE